MATLDELLALLPDNDTGQIDAADLRAIVTALWENDEGLLGAINSIGSGSDGEATVTGTWQINPQGSPGGQQVACDTASNFRNATELYFARIDVRGTDMVTILLGASRIYAQQQADATNWIRYVVTGTPTLSGTIVTVPVTVEAWGGTIHAADWQTAVAAIRTAGGSA